MEIDYEDFLKDYSDVSSDDFQMRLQQLLGMLDVTLEETTHTYTLYNPRMKNIVLPLSFVENVESICTEDGEITGYALNKALGMVSFAKALDCDMLTVTYTTKISDSYIKSSIFPVVLDMIRYYSTPESERNVSSIREGDVSISYDNGSSLHAIIYSRIDKIKSDLTNCSAMII